MYGRCFALLLLVLAPSLFAGCKVGPNYCPPTVPHACNWIETQHPRLLGQVDAPEEWWLVFGDEQLTNLINSAVDQNLNLKQACLRVAEARYRRGITAGGLFPQTQAVTGQYLHRQRSKNNANFAQGGPLRNFDQIALGLDAAWEIDFWGRFRRSLEAADGELDASLEGYHDAVVILLGDVANSYIEIRTLERQLQFAHLNRDIQQNTLTQAERKFKAGFVTELDVAQAKLNLHKTETQIPALELRHRHASNLLCILLGIPPTDLTSRICRTGIIPQPAGQVAVGIPADLLRQRPDVRQAERLLAAQSARIGVAESDFYPHISIVGTLNVESKNASNLFHPGSVAGVVGPSIRWDILNYGRIKNNVLAQDATFQRLAFAYQQQVLEAGQQVENGLATFMRTHDRIALLEQTVQAATRSVELSLAQYQAGTIDFNRVFQSQTEQVRQQDQLAIAQGELSKSLVSVYRALGGGWQLWQSGVPCETGADALIRLPDDSEPAPLVEDLPPLTLRHQLTTPQEIAKLQVNKRESVR